MSDDEGGLPSARDWSFHDAPSPAESTKSDTETDERMTGADAAPSQPIQKRRRVTRACDECRRKKIKCDGKQPCTHCSVYSYDCTYDKPSNRRRNPAPQYIEALENRLQRAETLLRKFMPDVDLTDSSLDPSIQQEFLNREQARLQAARLQVAQQPEPDSNDTHITSMINSIGQLEIDEKGSWDFHGTSSGTVFLKRMREHLSGMLGPFGKAPFLPRPDRLASSSSATSLSLGGNSPFSSTSNLPTLPPKEVARKLCYYSLSCATCLIRIVHVPTFYERFEALYARPLNNLSQEDTQFLSLFYAVLALGCMYNNLDESTLGSVPYRYAMDEGIKYFKLSKALLRDMTDCRSLASIQALLYIILFLQSTASPSTCYSFLGLALRSALRIGLHRHLQHERISDIEQQVRRRVFYVIRQMDIYVSAMLGFPLLLNSEDIDQQYPIEVDDEFVTAGGIIQPPPGTPSIFQAFNAHTRLMEILGKIVKYVYPTKGQGPNVMNGDRIASTFMISYGRIKEIETDLHDWYQRLPEAWRPSPDGPIEVVRVRHLLRFAYANVQLVLYRPFLHYVSPRLSQGSRVDELSYACAAAAISVSRNIVHIGLEIRKQRVLSGPYWFMLYTEFFSVLSLVFYAIENPDKPGSAEVLADAHAGRRMIAELAEKSHSAERVTQALKPLFDQLSDGPDESQPRPVNWKKRTAPTGKGPLNASLGVGMSLHRPQDLMRSRSSGMDLGGFGEAPISRGSIESMPHSSEHTFPDTTFSGTMHDFVSMDMSSRATPDSSSTGESSYRHQFQAHQLEDHNQVHRMDSLMFPSDDPFAYPNQPMTELGFSGKIDMAPATIAPQVVDSNFFFPASLESLSGDSFMGQPPPYMMQHQQHPMAMSLSGSLYDTSSILSMDSGQSHHQQQQPQQPQQQQQQYHQPPSRAQQPQQQPAPTSQQQPPPEQQQQQQRRSGFSFHRRLRKEKQQEQKIEQIFTDHGMQPDWGSFFGSGRGGFQGM